MANLLNDTYERYRRELATHQEAIKSIQIKMAALEEAGAKNTVDSPGQLTFAATAQRVFGGAPRRLVLPTINAPRRGDFMETVFSVVNEAPIVPLGTGDVRTRLLEQGYHPKGKYFTTTLSKTLRRLVERGRIRGEKDTQGEWAYYPLR